MERPLVSIIIPCFQEEQTVKSLLQAVREQTYPLQRMEVVFADGLSRDRTREEISEFCRSCPELDVRVLDNPDRIIPAALNIAIAASRGEILLRLDGHSAPAPGYVEGCVRLLEEGKGDMVGGGLEVVPRGDSWVARSIAAAVSHPAGVGDSHFRFSAVAQEVDTVAFCAFRREWVDRIGPYDETLLANEDYEFNSRFRRAKGRIWLDPAYRTRYYPPATFKGLFLQYSRYGYWKAKMARRSPETLRWRQILPPSTLLVSVALLVLGLWIPLFPAAFLVGMSAYLLVLIGVGIQQASRRKDPALVVGVPLAISTMHLSWAAAFLWSFPSALLDRGS